MPILVKIVHDGARNASVQVTGSGLFDWRTAVDLESLKPVPREVRLDAVYHAISERVEVQLAWHAEGSERLAFLPLGGRGKVDFGEVTGVHNNAPGKTGHIEIRAIGENTEGIFTLILDLS